MGLGKWRFLLFSLIILTAYQAPGLSAGVLEEGKEAVTRGDYAAAVTHWSRLLTASDDSARIEILIRRGEAFRALGRYEEAEADLVAARDGARQESREVLEAVATQVLGEVNFIQRDFAEAERQLRASLKQAERLDLPALAAAAANGLGNVQYRQDQSEEAEVSYGMALGFAQRAGDFGLVASAHRNRARLAAGTERALEELTAARKAAAVVEPLYERAELLLGIGVEAMRSVSGEAGRVLAHDVLSQALAIAERIDAPRLCSLAAGRLGGLYEKQNLLPEARLLNEKAIRAAQPLAADNLLVEWEWQLGRLLRAQGDRARAIGAFRRAAYLAQNLRQDISADTNDGLSSFRETLATIYHDLADLLLQESAEENDRETKQDLLREARDAVERIKVTELRDYLNDPCIAARTEGVISLSSTTAVLYPIIFPDRLDLLVDVGGCLHHTTIKVNSNRLAETVDLLISRIQGGASVPHEARQLYDWIVQPFASLLDENNVDTLVFVPDGPLRLFPISVLWDGERYLIERYAIVTAPGLTLLDPRPLPRERMQTLLAGLSRPGLVVNELPASLKESLLRAPPPGSGKSRSRGVPVTMSRPPAAAPDSSESEQRWSVGEELAQRLELKGVTREIAQLSRLLEGEVLLDEEFLLDNFARQVQSQPYRVVHIASHGFFGGTADQNFILTYNKKLGMNQLGSMLKPRKLADRPVELLTLSACQTAEGDDRTPLGLSGVALKSGARSVLGSLWPIDDEVAQKLLPLFYEHLREPDVTKAQALRKAQLSLLKEEEFRRPVYWAPFLLVGNWL
ncbi:MAG: CHAT domain-containing protein [Proteobacteria bacterium]|nr:CHAT domain-containing protein [Pseudomonadota bacterium]MBU4298141.1 CHAT domain-containing protein [Pseudomonadota bacterium]MCG2749519.1 CHAT domain-containing protein [Desulfobulbaceae bacterium]